MSFKYKSVSNPKWNNHSKTEIKCIVDIDGMGKVPYVVSENDVVKTSVEIFKACVNGDYGLIGAIEDEYESAINRIKSDKVNLINEVSAMMKPLEILKERGSITNDELKLLGKYQDYMIKVSRIESSKGYPLNVKFPVKPY